MNNRQPLSVAIYGRFNNMLLFLILKRFKGLSFDANIIYLKLKISHYS